MVQTRFSEKIEREKQAEEPEAKKRGRKPNDGLPTTEGSKKITKTILMEEWLANDVTKLAQDDGRAFSNYVNMVLLKEVKTAREEGKL